jgi:hypothetical protein
MLPTTVFTRAIANLFTEAYEGPADPTSTWFTDNEPGCAVLGTLDRLSAEQASVPFGQGAGSTIASHAEHLRWSLALSNALVRGEIVSGDWEQSWSVRTATATEWDDLRSALRREFETLRQTMRSQTDLPEQYVTAGIAIIAHGAYHLGAIRQIVRQLCR